MMSPSDAVYILDTNILDTLYFYPGPKRDAVLREIRRVGKEQLRISAISVYELTGIGAVPEINRFIGTPQAPEKLDRLIALIHKLSRFHILLFAERPTPSLTVCRPRRSAEALWTRG